VEHLEEAPDLLNGVGGAALLAIAKGRVRDPDARRGFEGDGFAFELDEGREGIWEGISEVVRTSR